MTTCKIIRKRIQKIRNTTVNIKKTKKQIGGAVASMDDFTYDDIALSKHVKINWGRLPGSPPTDCSIM